MFSWTKGYLLVCYEDTGRDLEELVAAAARDGSTVADLRGELALLGLNVDAPVPLGLRTVSAPARRTTGVQITSHVPDFVAEEVDRQRSVRKFTLMVLLILVVPYFIALSNSDESDRYSSVNANRYRPTWTYEPTYNRPPTLAPSNFPLPSIALPIITPPDLHPTYFDIVRPGDTLTKIACRHQTTVASLRVLNHMDSNNTHIEAGQFLRVPTSGPGIVEAGCR